jgi:hypothetical protein
MKATVDSANTRFDGQGENYRKVKLSLEEIPVVKRLIQKEKDTREADNNVKFKDD